jgi:hypothetical protein
MEDENYFQVELNYKGIKLKYTGLKQACEKWSGGDPEEQENLIAMRDNFYRLLLEFQFNQVD